MLKLLNISKREIIIDTIKIQPLESIVIEEPSEKVMNKITTLANLGLLKIFSYNKKQIKPVETKKKKSK